MRFDPELTILDRYCVFIESGQSYVVEQSPRFTFTRGSELQTWLAIQETTGGEGKGSSPIPAAGNS